MNIHWANLAKTAAVLAAIGLLELLKVPVPPALIAMGAAVITGAFPSWVKGWAP